MKPSAFRIEQAARRAGVVYAPWIRKADPAALMRLTRELWRGRCGETGLCSRCGFDHAICGVCERSREYFRDRYQRSKNGR